MHAYIHIHIYIYTYIHICICVCVCLYICIYIHIASSLWAAFLGPTSGPYSMLTALTMNGHGAPGVDAQYVKEESTRSGKGMGILGESLPSPPMSSSSMAGMMDKVSIECLTLDPNT